MQRAAMTELGKWKMAKVCKPFVVNGARRIGKTKAGW